MDTGEGKTPTSLAVAGVRHARGQVDSVLVVCLLDLIDQWKGMIAEWLPHAVIIDDPLARPEGLAFHVCHYEWAREQLKLLRKKPFDMMIADECHKLKSRSSKQGRRLALIGKTAMYRIGLTGTPVESNELDFFQPVKFVDDRIFGDWASFKEGWTRPAGFMGKKRVLRSSKKKEFLRRIEEISYMSTENPMGLPPMNEYPVHCRMKGRQLQAYQQMERDLVVILEDLDLDVAAPLVVTQLVRLQQITGGFLPREDRTPVFLGSSKMGLLEGIVEGHPAPLVVYCKYLPEIDYIQQRLKRMKRHVSVIHGGHKDSHKDFDILVCQVGIVAGLDEMQHVTSTCCFYSMPWSSVQYRQARGRIRRGGQKKKTTAMRLEAMSSVDLDISTAIQIKRDVIEYVCSNLRRRQ